ncbi:MAG: RHS repeat-associated core domain-containing protein [Burkholderiales bacterium]
MTLGRFLAARTCSRACDLSSGVRLTLFFAMLIFAGWAEAVITGPLWGAVETNNNTCGWVGNSRILCTRLRTDMDDQGALCQDYYQFLRENPPWAAQADQGHCYMGFPANDRRACSLFCDNVLSGVGIAWYCGTWQRQLGIGILDGLAVCNVANEEKNAGGCKDRCPAPMVGNPINPGYKNKYQEEVDFVGAGSHSLSFVRHYNSKGPVAEAAIGAHWRTSYDRALVLKKPPGVATIRAYRPDGRLQLFTLMKYGSVAPFAPYDPAAVWTTDADDADRVIRLVDGAGATTGWKYVSARNDETENYDASGRLTGIVARSGATQTLAYDAQGRLVTVTDDFGRQLQFAYDGNGRITTMVDPGGATYSYGYDTLGNLVSVGYPGGATRQYVYNEASLTAGTQQAAALTGIVDELGIRFANFGYDATGRPILTEYAGGAQRYTLAYPLDSTPVVTDPLGTARTYTFTTLFGVWKVTGISQPCANCGLNASAIAYDANGNVASRTDFNNKKVCYAYDLARNLETARVEGLYSNEVCSTALASPPNRPDVRKVTTTWHASFRLPVTTVEPAPGGTRTTTFTYDASGNLTQKSLVAPKNDGTSATVARTWSWTYGTLGRVMTGTDPNGRVTTYAYYADNDATLGKRGNVQSITNPLGHVTQFTAYDGNGRPLTVVDANGLTTTMAYDLRGRLTSRTVGGEQTSYVYDGVGQLTGVVMPDNSTLTYTYDAAHRLTQLQDGLGNRIVYTLDAAGNRTQERVDDPGGALARTRSRVFDALNRLALDLGAQAQATAYVYDGNGNPTGTTDPLSRATTNSYDALNRLTQVLDPAGGTTQYAYDAGGNLALVTDPRGLATAYTYDGLGNLTKQVSPDTGTTTSTFDAAGNFVTRTDARGATATYTLDAGNRVTTVVFSRSGTPSETHSYAYDSGANAKGRLTQLTDPAATTAWTYTAQGRVASKTQTTSGVTRTLAYGYNGAGQLTTITTPSGQQIGYGYLNNRVVSVLVNGTPLVNGIVTNPFGPVGAWQWGNGLYTFRDYDGDGRLSRWTLRNGTEVLRNDLTFDAASRITAIADPIGPARNGSYQYDMLNRLTVAQQGSTVAHTFQYGYDALGNRTTNVVDGAAATLIHGANTNRLQTMVGAISPSYFNGLASVTFAYSNANRLTEVRSGGTLATYAVNGLGQRVGKTVGATTTRFVYDEQGRLVGEYDATGQLIQETVLLDDLPIATLRPTGAGIPTPIAIYYVHADHLGSPRAITRPSDNALMWRWENAEPFGNNAADENPAGAGTFRYNLRFPGQYFDGETGMHYNYFRDYDPVVGRYAQSDPVGIRGGINTFLYSDARPVMSSDQFGLQAAPRGLWTYDPSWGIPGRVPPALLRPDGLLWGAGCGDINSDRWVPDGFLRADFMNACTSHDSCYETCGIPKATCDQKFGEDLFSECMRSRGSRACFTVVLGYRAAMSTKTSQSAFDAARYHCRDCP